MCLFLQATRRRETHKVILSGDKVQISCAASCDAVWATSLWGSWESLLVSFVAEALVWLTAGRPSWLELTELVRARPAGHALLGPVEHTHRKWTLVTSSGSSAAWLRRFWTVVKWRLVSVWVLLVLFSGWTQSNQQGTSLMPVDSGLAAGQIWS